MIYSSLNTIYIHTYLIKNQEIIIEHPFYELKNWIENKSNLKILNIVYRNSEINNQTELILITDSEFEKESLKSYFIERENFNQQKLIDEFNKLTEFDYRFKNRDFKIQYDSLENLSKNEIINLISKRFRKNIIEKVGDKELLDVSFKDKELVFKFNKRRKLQIENSPVFIDILSQICMSIIKKVDQFQYFKTNDLKIRIESD